jgi:hypothetical protein
MKITPNSIKLTAGSLAVATLLCLPVSTPAATPVTLTVNSSRSSITLAGNAFTLNYSQQSAGSLLDAFSGTITANEVGGVLSFSGGSSIVGLVNPAGPFSTSPYPGGPYAGNYGMTSGPSFVPPYGIVTVNGTYTGLTLDLTAGSVQNGSASSGLIATWTAGNLLWGAATSAYGPQGGSSSLVGVTGPDTSASLVSWDGTTLTLPVTFHTTGSNRYEDWSGTLVATVVVPEPTSLGLALLGLGLLAAKKGRRNS